MSYQVIARRYRPQNFDQVIGQEHITRTLKNAIESNRVHHAYLFAGARGIGKTTVARILAKAFNCEKGSTSDPCGKCPQCLEIVEGNSIDVQEIDGASNTGVDDVREIRERAKYMPTNGRYKVYIIDEVHMLSTAAFNALLKILEEPPAHVVFIFATTESHKIPVTILSRCQRYDFRRISSAKIINSLESIALHEGIKVEKDTLSLIAHEATGSLRDAQSLLDQAIAFAGKEITSQNVEAMLGFLDRKLLFDLIRSVIKKDPKKVLSYLNEVFDMGADINRFAMEFLTCLRHMLVIKECGIDGNFIELPEEEKRALADISKDVTYEEVLQMFQMWYNTADSIARSPFPKILLEVLLMRLIRVEPVRKIAQVIEELQGLTCGQKAEGREQRAENRGQRTEVREQKTEEPKDEKNWQGFVDWLNKERPQIASIFKHGSLSKMDQNKIEYSFENAFYAGMVEEADRKKQILGLIKKYFNKDMEIFTITNKIENNPSSPKIEQKQKLIKEALEHSAIKDATNILNAKVFEVKTSFDKKG